jgi:hypothetical protein
LCYLAPYVFRVAISDNRIVSCDHGTVTFTHRRVGSNRPRKVTLETHEFLRLFLQHVLPRGFQKVRHYGFQSPSSETLLEAVRWLITVALGAVFTLGTEPADRPPTLLVPRCPDCGGPICLLGFVAAAEPAVFDTS